MTEKTIICKATQLLEAARKQEKSLLALLRTLVELESPSDRKAAVDRCLDLVAQAAASRGASIHRHPRRHAGDVLEGRFNPPGRKRSAQKPTLLLGHIDTVWPIGTLARMPFRIRNGRAWGPGIFDMKAGLALALTALDLLRSANLLTRQVILLLTGDEETGSASSRALVEKIALRSRAVYVLEPAQGLEGAYKTARKGVASYRIHITGVAAHSGVNFEHGHSAIHELAHQITALESLTNLKRGITLNVGTIHGGTRSNVVAAEAWADIDVRISRAADFPRIDRSLQNLRARDRRCVIKVEGGLNRPPMERTPATAALYRKAATLAQAMGFKLQEAATGGGSDGNFTAALGIPTLDGMGAVGEGAHAPNESVLLSELAPRTALLAAMLCEP